MARAVRPISLPQMQDIIWGVSSEAEGQTNHPRREEPCVAHPLEADVTLHSLAHALTRL